MEHLSEQDLVLLAFGEAETDFGADHEVREHLRSCDRCTNELETLRHVVELGRESGSYRGTAPTPPPSVWDGIAHELALPTPGDPPAEKLEFPSAPRARGQRSRRRWLIAASIAAAAVLGTGAGVLIGRATADRPPASATTSSAALAPVSPDGPAEAAGTATVTRGPDGATLTVATAHLPLQQGFYQVWLYDQTANKMVPIGTLDGAGQGTFTLTPSIDLRSFNVVDISAQQLNGDPAHGSSMLRGALTQ